MKIATSECHRFGHPDFVISFDEQAVVREDITSVIRFLEESVCGGTKYSNGDTLQIGWMVNLIRCTPDGKLALFEPDMVRLPIEWAEGVTTTAQHLRLHKDAVESVGLHAEVQFPSIWQGVVWGADVQSGSTNLVLERTSPESADSGWFIGCTESTLDYNDPANLRRTSLYEAAIAFPRAIMFLALPAGVRVFLEQETLEISRYGQLLNLTPGSFLARAFS